MAKAKTDTETDVLDDDANLPTTIEGTDLGEPTAEDGPSPTSAEEFLEQNDALPGAPKNEFEALKERLLSDGAQVDEVTVNEEVIDDEEETGELFHEHTNYDTMVLNHPGGPYLTDVDNARTKVIAERGMAKPEDREVIDLEAARIEADSVAETQAKEQANADIAEREGKLQKAADAAVTDALTESSTTGTSIDDILNGTATDPNATPGETVDDSDVNLEEK